MEKQESSIIIYTTEDGSTNLQVKMENETVWLTQSQLAELFHKDQSVIARHISNVFKEGELEKGSNMQILHNTLSKYKPTSVYSLDVIISVGYRVKSKRGVQFRQWANRVLKEYLVKGYAINEDIKVERWKQAHSCHAVSLVHGKEWYLNFNCVEFDIIKSQAGLNSYCLSAKEWKEKTNPKKPMSSTWSCLG